MEFGLGTLVNVGLLWCTCPGARCSRRDGWAGRDAVRSPNHVGVPARAIAVLVSDRGRDPRPEGATAPVRTPLVGSRSCALWPGLYAEAPSHPTTLSFGPWLAAHSYAAELETPVRVSLGTFLTPPVRGAFGDFSGSDFRPSRMISSALFVDVPRAP